MSCQVSVPCLVAPGPGAARVTYICLWTRLFTHLHICLLNFLLICLNIFIDKCLQTCLCTCLHACLQKVTHMFPCLFTPVFAHYVYTNLHKCLFHIEAHVYTFVYTHL